MNIIKYIIDQGCFSRFSTWRKLLILSIAAFCLTKLDPHCFCGTMCYWFFSCLKKRTIQTQIRQHVSTLRCCKDLSWAHLFLSLIYDLRQCSIFMWNTLTPMKQELCYRNKSFAMLARTLLTLIGSCRIHCVFKVTARRFGKRYRSSNHFPRKKSLTTTNTF